jgi:predicted ATPase
MITRVEIDGFKSLRGFSVDLEPLTAIVGPNAVGKSNLFDALQILSRLADTDVTAALGAGRGSRLEQFSRMQGGETGARIGLGVDLLLSPSTAAGALPQTRFRYWIELSRERTPAGLDKIVLEGERLEAMAQADDAWIARHADLAPFARYGEPGVRVSMVEDVSPLSASRRTLQWTSNPATAPSRLTMGTLGMEQSFLAYHLGISGPLPALVEAVGDALRGFRFLQLEPTKLRLPSDRAAPTTLASDGSNLPTALAALAPEVRAEIRADLARLVPSFKSFDVVSHDDELRIEVELTSGQRLPARVLSDGTLRLLALFLLLRSASPGTLIAIEEPENGVHPGSLRGLIEELVDATTPRGALPPQVLLNSHSPALVAALHRRPESLVFADLVRRADGLHATRMRHVWREGDPKDRGATTVSTSEVERILDTARPADEVA